MRGVQVLFFVFCWADSGCKRTIGKQTFNLGVAIATTIPEYRLTPKHSGTCARGHDMAIIDVKTEITGNVWKIVAEVGDALEEDDPIMILESMKMEIPVGAPEDGVVKEILTEEGAVVTEGTVVARIEA